MASRCPECQQITGADVGKPTTVHQKPGSRERCPGSGQTSQPV